MAARQRAGSSRIVRDGRYSLLLRMAISTLLIALRFQDTVCFEYLTAVCVRAGKDTAQRGAGVQLLDPRVDQTQKDFFHFRVPQIPIASLSETRNRVRMSE